MNLALQHFRPVLTLLGALGILLAAFGLIGCGTTPHADKAAGPEASQAQPGLSAQARFELDRKAILGMVGEYKVRFDFHEIMPVRQGYELAEPYHSEATELVKVISDTGSFISLQHLLVVWTEGKPHVVKHWRQDWQYEGTEMYRFAGENRWLPTSVAEADARGAWVQSVFQVDDSPRYWGVGRWSHADGVSTWSAESNRPLPRRESTRRSDYQIVGGVNTHIITPQGWVHEQRNRKIDIHNDQSPVIALEIGVNTYTKTDQVDFAAANEYWEKTRAYWQQVRAEWQEVYAQREPIELADRVRGDTMSTHFFDLSDLYWGKPDASQAREQIREIIKAFLTRPAVARQ